MRNVVNMKDYRTKLARESSDAVRDGLIPIEFAIGINNREQCLDKMSTYGLSSSIHVRSVNDEPGALLYLIGIGDAILLNKKILAGKEVSEEEIERRIDLIQMMENMNFVGMDSLWESFSSQNENVI
ncbi:MAG: hypothetical protein ACI80L_001937 [Pseudohongiellaceae bacterium]|jgi:hypothetical protein